jgi:hypothetical protein
VNGLEDGMKKTLDITKVVGNEMRMANKGWQWAIKRFKITSENTSVLCTK